MAYTFQRLAELSVDTEGRARRVVALQVVFQTTTTSLLGLVFNGGRTCGVSGTCMLTASVPPSQVSGARAFRDAVETAGVRGATPPDKTKRVAMFSLADRVVVVVRMVKDDSWYVFPDVRRSVLTPTRWDAALKASCAPLRLDAAAGCLGIVATPRHTYVDVPLLARHRPKELAVAPGGLVRLPWPKAFQAANGDGAVQRFVLKHYSAVNLTANVVSMAQCGLVEQVLTYLGRRYHTPVDFVSDTKMSQFAWDPKTRKASVKNDQALKLALAKAGVNRSRVAAVIWYELRGHGDHALLALYDGKDDVLVLYDPNLKVRKYALVGEWLVRLAASIVGRPVVLDALKRAKGVTHQSFDELCASWTAYFMALWCLNPDIPPDALAGVMARGGLTGLLRFLAWITHDFFLEEPCTAAIRVKTAEHFDTFVKQPIRLPAHTTIGNAVALGATRRMHLQALTGTVEELRRVFSSNVPRTTYVSPHVTLI